MSDVVYSEDYRFESPTKTRLAQEHRERRRRNLAPIGSDIRIVKDTGIDLRSKRPQGIDGYRAAYERQEARKLRPRSRTTVEKPVENLLPADLPVQKPNALDGEPLYLIADILREVSRQTGKSVEDIKSARRTADIIPSRHIAMTLCKHLTLRSLPEIGRKIGMRDHTTVLHAARKYERVIAELIARVPKGSSIAVWVAEFMRETQKTKPSKWQSTGKAIEQA